MIIGRDGRIWVRSHTPTEAMTAEWIGFARTGQALCRARLPRQTISEIGADYVLMYGRDSLGVERVAEFRFRVGQ
jgi:hypothetical protein